MTIYEDDEGAWIDSLAEGGEFEPRNDLQVRVDRLETKVEDLEIALAELRYRLDGDGR